MKIVLIGYMCVMSVFVIILGLHMSGHQPQAMTDWIWYLDHLDGPRGEKWGI
jgi:hypothetical protein